MDRRAAVLSLCSKIFRGLSNKSCLLWRSTVLLICNWGSHYTNKTVRQTDSELLQGQFATMRRKLSLFFFSQTLLSLCRDGLRVRTDMRLNGRLAEGHRTETKNKQTSWHITRNATSKREQTQPEDCFFLFIFLWKLQTDKSKPVSQLDGRADRTVYVTATVCFIFPHSSFFF